MKNLSAMPYYKQEILKIISAEEFFHYWPIKKEEVNTEINYTFLIIDSQNFQGFKSNWYPRNKEYHESTNVFIKIQSEQNDFCFYMQKNNPATLKCSKKTAERYKNKEFDKLLDSTGYGENWFIVPMHYLAKLEEKKEVIQSGFPEEEITNKQTQFSNMISKTAAISLLEKEKEPKKESTTNEIIIDQPKISIEKNIAIYEKKKQAEKITPFDREKNFTILDEKTKNIITFNFSIMKEFLANSALTDKEILLFCLWCGQKNFNAFNDEAYCIKYSNDKKASFVINYLMFIRRAKQFPDYHGFKGGIIIEDHEKQEQKREGSRKRPNETLLGGWVQILLKDKPPLYWEVDIKEFDSKITSPKYNYWKANPEHMIFKVALERALRMVYPDEFLNVYGSEEIISEQTQ